MKKPKMPTKAEIEGELDAMPIGSMLLLADASVTRVGDDHWKINGIVKLLLPDAAAALLKRAQGAEKKEAVA